MPIYNTQEDFLKDFPIQDGVLNCRGDDLTLKFNLYVPEADIVNAWSIKAKGTITAWSINTRNITTFGDIIANGSITSTGRIKVSGSIKANGDITAISINASGDITYYGVCIAYNSLKCKSIEGRRENSKHFCLDGDIEITGN